jgi:predicted alpha/beta-fold hydrolase
MPVLKKTDLKSPFWLPNGHMQSIYPALFRQINGVAYRRERIVTADHDFLDLDWSYAHKTGPSRKLVILSHGLEGNSTRQYILGMVRLLNQNGYDCLAWNFRSCSGEMNKSSRFYHSGATDDLELIINQALRKGYSSVDLIGFSLGGNLTLKYLGEAARAIDPRLRKAVVFSVPMDLKACSLSIIRRENMVYMHRFLMTLRPKVDEKALLFPDMISSDDYRHVKTLYDFDNIYTAPLHGFSNADHYYEACSSMHFVENISIPTLIVNAENDPIVPYMSLPMDVISKLSNVWLEVSKEGGHCGFRPSSLKNGVYWSESRALDFISTEAY